ncbi:MAG: globin [Planctomycetota bacterium]
MTSESSLEEHEIYDVVGDDGFRRICEQFYIGVRADDILGPMYPADDMEGAETRLREFLIYRFGGPADYIENRGHPRLRARHFPFAIDRQARDRWAKLMTSAVDAAELDTRAVQPLKDFFNAMATFLVNRTEDA